MNKKRFIFGPVPSRRLGISLGIDLIPFKICSMDCIYCECGATTDFTIARKEFFLLNEIISELDQVLRSNPKLDYITFSGSGEPTLYSRLGELVSYIKKNYPQYKVALITNSSLLFNNDLLDEISQLDLIVPSLDAATEEVYQKINRPTNESKISEIIDGLIRLKERFLGKIWLEIFLVSGINDSDDQLRKLAEIAKKINPDKVQLNSLDRPGTEKWVRSITGERMQEIKKYFQGLNIEAIGRISVANDSVERFSKK